MPWYCIYRTADGVLESIGSVDPGPLADRAVLERPDRPADSEMWDPASRSWVARPAKVIIDRLQDLVNDPELSAVWQRLTQTQRDALRNRLIRFMGTQRFRSASTTVDL